MAEFKLPTGIMYNDKLYNIAHLEEMCGKQQNYLVNPNPRTAVDHLEPILKDLLTDIRTEDSESIKDHLAMDKAITHYLPIQDIQYLMAKLREITYDNIMVLEQKCTHCDHKNHTKLDLSTLEVFPAVHKLKPSEMILPRSKKPFAYKPLYLAELKKASDMQGGKKIAETIITEMTAILLAHIDNKSPITAADVESLKGKDIEFLHSNAPTLAALDTQIITTCEACKRDFEQELPVLEADFLLPTRT